MTVRTIRALLSLVGTLVLAGSLNGEIAPVTLAPPLKALLAKVTAARQAIEAGDQGAACEALQDFLNHVAAQRGKKISPTEADRWSAAARHIRNDLGCT